MGSGISLVLHVFFSVILTKGSYFEIRDFLFVFPKDEAFFRVLYSERKYIFWGVHSFFKKLIPVEKGGKLGKFK